jgi:hypothetical protein
MPSEYVMLCRELRKRLSCFAGGLVEAAFDGGVLLI